MDSKSTFTRATLVNVGQRNIAILIIQRIVYYKVEDLPITYLGIPVRMGRLVKRDWAVIFDKLEKRLNGWKARALSLGGWLTLVNAILSAMPIFLMSCLIILKWIASELTKYTSISYGEDRTSQDIIIT